MVLSIGILHLGESPNVRLAVRIIPLLAVGYCSSFESIMKTMDACSTTPDIKRATCGSQKTSPTNLKSNYSIRKVSLVVALVQTLQVSIYFGCPEAHQESCHHAILHLDDGHAHDHLRQVQVVSRCHSKQRALGNDFMLER